MILSRLSALAAILLVSACAFTDETISIPYQTTTPPISIGVDGKTFKLIVVDSRGFETVGKKINGYGVETADIRSAVPVQQIITDAVIAELLARKIAVDGAQARNLNVNVKQFNNKFTVGLLSGESEAVVELAITLQNANGETLYYDEITESHLEEGIILFTGNTAKEPLENALRNAIEALFQNTKFLQALVAA